MGVCLWMFLVWIQACFCTDSPTSTDLILWRYCIDFFALFTSFRQLFRMFTYVPFILFSVFCSGVYISAINRIYRQLLKVSWLVWILLNCPTSSAQVCVCMSEPAFLCILSVTMRRLGFKGLSRGLRVLLMSKSFSLRLAWIAGLILCVRVCLCVCVSLLL